MYAMDEKRITCNYQELELRSNTLEKQEEETYIGRESQREKKVQMASDIKYLLSTAVIRV